ncbi:uncharacterized protein LOC143860111 isoform X2 [Tasmannia lanceolata]|uniref:uncharacterized protein LOC143860111 isoform X2 n=1 Tax=Tasmannia lanceolata TaxID=3420 RepID=UPI0040648512
MDKVELPLPLSKLVAAQGLRSIIGAGTEEAEALDSDVSHFRTLLPTHTPRGRDIPRPVTNLERRPIPTNRTDVELCVRGSLLCSFECQNSSKPFSCKEADNPSALFPKCMGKQLHRRSGKMSKSSSPCCKRPRADQLEDSTSLAGADDDNVMFERSRSNLARCTAVEKSRVVKQKHGQDGKRGVKKGFRAAASTKFDILSKASSVSSNSAAGNNILGMYGLKSDLHDVTKYVDDLSLNQLLDGSYECPNLRQDKGKKVSNTNENIIHSVRKACSILSLHNAVEFQNAVELDHSCNRRMHTSLLGSSSCFTSTTDHVTRENCTTADLESSSKVSRSKPGALASLNDAILYQPKDLLERLALPPAKDLDALLVDTSTPPLSFEMTDRHSGTTKSHQASLPPFPWSLSHSGPYKLNIDCGKFFTNRSTCHVRWLIIGSNASFLGTVRNGFSNLNFVTHDHTVVPSGKLMIEGSPEIQKILCTSVKPPCWSYTVTCPPASHDEDKIISKKGSGVMCFPERCVDSSDGRLELGCKEHLFRKMAEAEGSLKYQGNEAFLLSSSPNNLLVQENVDIYSDINQSKRMYGCTDRHTVGGCDQHLWQLPLPANSNKDGHSPMILAAAQILCEIASYTNVTEKKDKDSKKLGWPMKPSQKATKACKLRSIMGTTEGFSATPKSITKLGHSVKSAERISSQECKVSTSDRKQNYTDLKNNNRGMVKWSVPNAVEDCDSQQKQRRAGGTVAPVGKGWARGRSKKE